MFRSADGRRDACLRQFRVCYPFTGANLCTLRLSDHWSRCRVGGCLILLRSLRRTTRHSPAGRPRRGEKRRMKLSEIMTREVEVIQPDDSLRAAAQKMRDRDIGFLPVCDGETLMGVLSDRDITIRALADGMDINVMLSRDLMTTPAIYCFDDQDVTDAAKLMAENQIRRLVILGRGSERVVGVISLGDLARKGITDISGQVLQRVSEPENQETPKAT